MQGISADLNPNLQNINMGPPGMPNMPNMGKVPNADGLKAPLLGGMGDIEMNKKLPNAGVMPTMPNVRGVDPKIVPTMGDIDVNKPNMKGMGNIGASVPKAGFGGITGIGANVKGGLNAIGDMGGKIPGISAGVSGGVGALGEMGGELGA